MPGVSVMGTKLLPASLTFQKTMNVAGHQARAAHLTVCPEGNSGWGKQDTKPRALRCIPKK